MRETSVKAVPVAAVPAAALLRLILIALALLVSACTTVGIHDRERLGAIDFGPKEELRICVLTDEGITEKEARRLIGKVGDEFSLFGLVVKVPWVRQWVRPAFLMEGILEDVAVKPLDAPCDRLLALVGRHAGDFFFGLFGAEVLGAVETVSHTRGYVVEQTASLNQLIERPADVAIHESYHLLGCKHELSLADCYPRIRDLKRTARANRERGNDFFPGVSWMDKPIASREETDDYVTAALMHIRTIRGRESYGPWAP
jgi:hypothetical protein